MTERLTLGPGNSFGKMRFEAHSRFVKQLRANIDDALREWYYGTGTAAPHGLIEWVVSSEGKTPTLPPYPRRPANE